MDAISEALEPTLKAAGWFRGRKVDTAVFLDHIRAQGGVSSDPVVQFLEEFGGLRIAFATPGPARFHTVVCDSRTVNYAPDELAECARRLWSPVCPVGTARHDLTAGLLMAEDGHVYVDDDGTLSWLGRSGVDAVEALRSNRPLPPPAP